MELPSEGAELEAGHWRGHGGLHGRLRWEKVRIWISFWSRILGGSRAMIRLPLPHGIRGGRRPQSVHR